MDNISDNGVLSLATLVAILESSAHEFGATSVLIEMNGELRSIDRVMFDAGDDSIRLIGKAVPKRSGTDVWEGTRS
jgi:hypothetical protein